MGLGEFVLGVAVLATALASAAWVASVVLRRRLGGLRGAPLVVGWAVVFTAALIAVHLIPALVGLLSPLAVVVTAAVCAAAVTRVPARPARPELAVARHEPAPAESRWSWFVVGASASALVGWFAVYARATLAEELRHPDLLTFHLPTVARWLQRDSIWGNDQFVPFFANGNYPQNGNVLHLAAILPFDQDAFVRFVFHPLLALTVVAVYALARELGAARPLSWLAGLAFAALPVLAYGTTQAGTDNLLFFGFTAGALFLLRHRRTGARAELVLAGLALGLAFGTKWYGVSGVLAFLALWGLQRVVAERRVVPAVRDGLVVGGLIALAGGVWLVRNLAFTPSPVFPSPVRPLGVTIFDAPPDPYTERFGLKLVDYLFDGRIWVDRILPDWWDALGPAPAIAIGGVVVAVVLLATRRWAPIAGASALVLCCAGAGLLLALYTVTPHTAYGPEGDPLLVGPNSRYGLTGIVLALAVTAAVAVRLGRRAVVVAELALAAAVVVGVSKAAPASEKQWAVATLLLLGVAFVAARGRERLAALRGPVLAAAAATVLVVLAVGAREVQQRQAAARYAEFDPVSAWITRHAGTGHRIGIAGNFADVDPALEPPRPIYPAFGPRLGNRVAYVGPFVDGMLQRYGDAQAFARALERGRHDLLIVYRHGTPPRPAPEERWALASGFRVLVSADTMALLRRGG